MTCVEHKKHMYDVTLSQFSLRSVVYFIIRESENELSIYLYFIKPLFFKESCTMELII
jgi:hypothetical protein